MAIKRRIIKGKVKFLSLCPRGANTLETLYKSDDSFGLNLLTKDLTEAGELLAVVYAPELRDSQGDIASAQVIKDMLYTAARDGMELDIRHDNKAIPREKAYVAEQFLIQKGDPRFVDFKDYDGNAVDVTGAWGVVLKIDDPGLRTLYREGAWNGVSMGGSAAFQITDKAAAAASHFESHLTEFTMTEEEMTKLATLIAKGVADALPKPAAPEAPKPAAPEGLVFKGDPTNLKDVAKHAEALRKDALFKSTDWSDPESVAELQKSLAPVEDQQEAEIKKLEEKLAKLQGRSAQGAGDGGSTGQTEEQRLTAMGKAMAVDHSKLLGRV